MDSCLLEIPLVPKRCAADHAAISKDFPKIRALQPENAQPTNFLSRPMRRKMIAAVARVDQRDQLVEISVAATLDFQPRHVFPPASRGDHCSHELINEVVLRHSRQTTLQELQSTHVFGRDAREVNCRRLILLKLVKKLITTAQNVCASRDGLVEAQPAQITSAADPAVHKPFSHRATAKAYYAADRKSVV